MSYMQQLNSEYQERILNAALVCEDTKQKYTDKIPWQAMFASFLELAAPEIRKAFFSNTKEPIKPDEFFDYLKGIVRGLRHTRTSLSTEDIDFDEVTLPWVQKMCTLDGGGDVQAIQALVCELHPAVLESLGDFFYLEKVNAALDNLISAGTVQRRVVWACGRIKKRIIHQAGLAGTGRSVHPGSRSSTRFCNSGSFIVGGSIG